MPSRKKRLEKGINSLSEQIEYHKEKLIKANEEGNAELGRYYEKEIQSLGNAVKRKEQKLEK
jgi:phage shock protein A